MSQQFLDQMQAAALCGLLDRDEVTIDLPRVAVPEPDGLSRATRQAAARIVSSLAGMGVARRHGYCTSVRPEIHDGLIRRFIISNRPAAEAQLADLKRRLGSAFIEPTADQIREARPRDIHLPMRMFGGGQTLLFPIFPDDAE
ncbi:MAG: hypothetical protein Fues2KO_50540 [Fuerstiella sp.]